MTHTERKTHATEANSDTVTAGAKKSGFGTLIGEVTATHWHSHCNTLQHTATH